MEKKLKRVQRGAAVGFVLLKILRILLIIAFVAMISGLVFLAVANENDLPLNAVKDGKLVIDMQDLDLSQLNLDKVPNLGGLIHIPYYYYIDRLFFGVCLTTIRAHSKLLYLS